MADIRMKFDEAMMNIYRVAKERCKYTPQYFFNMLVDRGGLSTAKRLLSKEGISYGFDKLYWCQCLDLTVECLVLKPRFQGLFEPEELETARKRLRDHRFDPAKCECD